MSFEPPADKWRDEDDIPAVRLSIVIQAHPLRQELAEQLAVAAGADLICYDDEEPRNPWRGYQKALRRMPAWASHLLVLQDDAIVCPRFRAAAAAAVAARPGRLVAMFVGGMPAHYASAVREACAAGDGWALLLPGYWFPVVATCWPRELADQLLEWADAQDFPPKFTSDDERVGAWLQAAALTGLGTVPSLVQHPDVVPSLIGDRAAGGGDTGRIAACWIGEECDPRNIDWQAGPL